MGTKQSTILNDRHDSVAIPYIYTVGIKGKLLLVPS
jgi:hypothetical protein